MAWSTPRTWVADELVTATLLNTHLRDQLDHLGSHDYVDYTPTLTNLPGTAVGRYAETGAIVHFEVTVSPSSPAAGGAQVTLPIIPARTGISFRGLWADGGLWRSLMALHTSGTTLALYRASSTAGVWEEIAGASAPHTASGDTLIITGTYEGA